ncbi:hypothetical protein AB3R30_14605 [Leptolyngbyaceae cyanobacterium UHCC 1019]
MNLRLILQSSYGADRLSNSDRPSFQQGDRPGLLSRITTVDVIRSCCHTQSADPASLPA